MCGTFTTIIDGRVLSELLVKEESHRKRNRQVQLVGLSDLPPVQETLFPGGSAWILDGKAESWQLRQASWGLLPDWAKDQSLARNTYNARLESVAEKPAFRDALREERCIVPARAWFEFRGPAKNKERIRYTPPEGQLFAMAGLRHCWKGLETFTIITVQAQAPVTLDHHRMPLLLDWNSAEEWLERAKMVSLPTPVHRVNESKQESFLDGLV